MRRYLRDSSPYEISLTSGICGTLITGSGTVALARLDALWLCDGATNAADDPANAKSTTDGRSFMVGRNVKRNLLKFTPERNLDVTHAMTYR